MTSPLTSKGLLGITPVIQLESHTDGVGASKKGVTILNLKTTKTTAVEVYLLLTIGTLIFLAFMNGLLIMDTRMI